MARKPDKKTAIADSLAHNNAYREMLAEVVSSPGQSDEDGRSVKKRRVAGRIITQTPPVLPSQQYPEPVQPKRDDSLDHLFEDVPDSHRPLQQVEQTESEDSADSDVNWEQVDLKQTETDRDNIGSEMNDEPQGLNLVLQDEKPRALRPAADRRKPITAAEKKLRLVVHKMNVSCLLTHVHVRNHWCNDDTAHAILRRLLTKKMVSYLTHDDHATQFQQSRSFMEGLQQASDAFRTHYRISARGMARPKWAHPELLQHMRIPHDIDLPMQREDFIQAAKDLSASRDVGAQLFCALLRSAGVDARLVCSLQPLPFRAAEKTGTPQQKYAMVIDEPASRETSPESNSEASRIRHPSPPPIGPRGGQSRFANRQPPPQANPTTKRRIRESSNPVYWTEAFSPSIQKWLPLDPLTTNTIAKPSKICPSFSSSTPLTYAIAFEDDLSAHDVTRRYSRVYNAKTIKDRVESTNNGRAWFNKLIRMFRRPHGENLDRDQLEQAELSQKEAQEPMPRGVQDFKDHPYYALERHLKRHEVIHPKREVGKVGGAGKGHDKQNLEIVYRRRDVVAVLSADKWYRAHGRVVNPGEQPLKRVTAQRKNRRGVSEDEDGDDDEEEQRLGTPLYAITQTQLYEPQPVTADAKIPKNAYGNLDIYHAHMIPAGAAHIHHPETSRVARLLGIDYADAVTGFSFKGRHGTAITIGAVVCATHVDAVQSIIEAVEDEKADAELEARSQRAIALWAKLMRGLRIRERIEAYAGDANDATAEDETDEEEEGGGGFLPDRNATSEIAEPTAPSTSPIKKPSLPSSDPRSALPSLLPPRPPIKIVYGPPLPTSSPPKPITVPSALPQHQRSHTPCDDNNDCGGGFLIDSTPSNTTPITLKANTAATATATTANPTLHNDDNEAATDSDEDDDAALRTAIARSVLDSQYEYGELDRDDGGEGPSGTTAKARGKVGDGIKVEDMEESRGVDKGDEGRAEDKDGNEVIGEEEGSEMGSLMSHDPDDEEEEVMEL